MKSPRDKDEEILVIISHLAVRNSAVDARRYLGFRPWGSVNRELRNNERFYKNCEVRYGKAKWLEALSAASA